MSDIQKYDDAVKVIKTAILKSQYEAAKSVNERQLMLYYGIGKYISQNSREGFWGKGAIDAISEQLSKELPGLRGFTSRNLRYMRTFYEEWKMLDTAYQYDQISDTATGVLELTSSKTSETVIGPIWNLQLPNYKEFPLEAFLHIGFTHHRIILRKVKDIDERLFYIKWCASEHLTVEALEDSISADDYHHQGSLPNNFMSTISIGQQALKAISTFKDEYLLDYIDAEDMDEE